jgi:hypothetical protein
MALCVAQFCDRRDTSDSYLLQSATAQPEKEAIWDLMGRVKGQRVSPSAQHRGFRLRDRLQVGWPLHHFFLEVYGSAIDYEGAIPVETGERPFRRRHSPLIRQYQWGLCSEEVLAGGVTVYRFKSYFWMS